MRQNVESVTDKPRISGLAKIACFSLTWNPGVGSGEGSFPCSHSGTQAVGFAIFIAMAARSHLAGKRGAREYPES